MFVFPTTTPSCVRRRHPIPEHISEKDARISITGVLTLGEMFPIKIPCNLVCAGVQIKSLQRTQARKQSSFFVKWIDLKQLVYHGATPASPSEAKDQMSPKSLAAHENQASSTRVRRSADCCGVSALHVGEIKTGYAPRRSLLNEPKAITDASLP